MKLIPENDKGLSTPCEAYDFESEDLTARLATLEHMIQMMVASKGIGLAAPQIGRLTQLFVIEADGARFPCYNPEIVDASQNMASDYEGCLSFPDLFFKVARPDWVVGKFQDINGVVITRRFDGLAARCFQHELDHLRGICFTRRVGPITLQMAQKRRIKHRKTRK
jgi:peptide deformylase